MTTCTREPARFLSELLREVNPNFPGSSFFLNFHLKNLYLTPAKNPVRKLKEAVLTWRLERNLSKRRIIELYLNVAEWGEGIFGIEAAARHYFGKGADLKAFGKD